MTYNEWRDELKNNLLTVTDAERRRVLDYYAEAYADRREAGFSEREIIENFGAPYDAAQRILYENADDDCRRETHPRDEETNRKNNNPYCEGASARRETFYEKEEARQARREERVIKRDNREDYTWVFVILCIIFALPLFGLVMTMVGVTIGLCVAPFSILISGLGSIIAGIATMFSNVVAGVIALGTGFVVVGVAVMLFPLFFKLVKWMWKLFNIFFRWLKGLFSGKERV